MKVIFSSYDSGEHFPRVVIMRDNRLFIYIFDYDERHVTVAETDSLEPCTRRGCRCPRTDAVLVGSDGILSGEVLVHIPDMVDPDGADWEMERMRDNPEAFLTEVIL